VGVIEFHLFRRPRRLTISDQVLARVVVVVVGEVLGLVVAVAVAVIERWRRLTRRRRAGLEIKGVPPTMLRSPVTSVSFHPRNPSALAATLQSGLVIFWDTRREGIDSFCVVRQVCTHTHTHIRVRAHTHTHNTYTNTCVVIVFC
jgi:hypothetical protein